MEPSLAAFRPRRPVAHRRAALASENAWGCPCAGAAWRRVGV